MGVFAMFRRKGKEAAEASPEEARTVAPTEDAEEAEAASPEAGDSRPAATEGGTGDGVTAVAAEGDDGAEAVVEAVEIPKQQSAEAAADNEAGEGARK